ncbi:hypothetical protein [Herbaspirillum huttiense]|uniref:hypothetical protein n=1 Tax=Herbaspirillum huttiense TaxID=863372 RepID=UPI0031D0CBD7
MKTTDYMDQVKAKLNLPSDYALAKVLGISNAAVSALRHGKSSMGIETAMKVGEILQIDEHIIYSHGQIERARTEGARGFWITTLEKFSTSFESLMRLANPRPA